MSLADPYSYIQANVDGRLSDARQPTISPLDRGFLYGDAIYEVWRTYQGVVFAWDEHWQRLEATAAGLGLELPFDKAAAISEVKKTVSAWRESCGKQKGELYVRLQISRGAGPIGLDTALADRCCFAILVKALPELELVELEAGMRLSIARKWRRNSIEALPPSLKTGNYLNNIQGLREAKESGADDVVFLNAAGDLTEASTRNLWLVLPDRIATPPLSAGLLSGVTRRLLLDSIGEIEGLPLVEETISPSRLAEARECFLTSTTQDVQPVSQVDEFKFATGTQTVTRKLKRAFESLVGRYVASRPDLRV